MADTGGQEKTEAATPRRREQAREEGNVPRSTELNSVLLLIVAVLALYLLGPRTFSRLIAIQDYYLSHLNDEQFEPSLSTVPAIVESVMKEAFLIVFPFTVAFIVGAAVINLAQVGFLFTTKSLKPKPSRLSPLEGAKRIFSARGVMELTKSLLKLAIVAPLMYSAICGEVPLLASIADESVRHILPHLGYAALRVVWKALLILLVLALIDFAFQRYQHEKDLRMTKQEVKEELKNTQGDPQIKARIRQVQREVARRRMMSRVPEADVVVTNPTEYAIALKYRQGVDAAPVVLAKGRGLVAQRIKQLARGAGVPLFEDRPLAQALYKLVEIGGSIPAQLYEGVARALAFVYRMQEQARNKRRTAAGF